MYGCFSAKPLGPQLYISAIKLIPQIVELECLPYKNSLNYFQRQQTRVPFEKQSKSYWALVSSLEPTCSLKVRGLDCLNERTAKKETIRRDCPEVTG